MTHVKRLVNPRSIQNLVKLGLTKAEAMAYTTLLRQGPSTINELNLIIKVLPSALHRTVNNLLKKKFATQNRSYPKTVQAIPPEVAVDALLKDRIITLEQSRQTLIEVLKDQTAQEITKIKVCFGKNELFREGVKQTNACRLESQIISIGEPIPKELILAYVRLIKRGGDVKMIVHKYDKENRDLLLNWKKNGYQIRHYKDWGYHIVVFDEKVCHISVNNPKQTDERVSIYFFNPALAKAMKVYFFTLWNKAVEIK